MPSKEPKKVANPSQATEQIDGFNIKINEFGEIICSHSMDKINDFLDETVEDKKLPPTIKAQKKNNPST